MPILSFQYLPQSRSQLASQASTESTCLRPASMRDWCAQISVCGLELWPEARKCEDDWRLGQGVLGGTVLMGWTLYIGI